MSTQTFLSSAGVRLAVWPIGLVPVLGVYCTAAGQMMGSYSDLKQFQRKNRAYLGWHAHHIVESQDFERLGVAENNRPWKEPLCVLLPERAHIGRINSILRRQNPNAVVVTAHELRSAYSLAYSMMGDYCGGGEARIRGELLAIVRGTLRQWGLGVIRVGFARVVGLLAACRSRQGWDRTLRWVWTRIRDRQESALKGWGIRGRRGVPFGIGWRARRHPHGTGAR